MELPPTTAANRAESGELRGENKKMKHLGKGSCRRPRWVGGWEERITIATTTLPCAATTTAAAIFQCGCWIGKIQQQQTVTLLPPQAILLSPPPSLSLSLSLCLVSFPKVHEGYKPTAFSPLRPPGCLARCCSKREEELEVNCCLVFYFYFTFSLSLYLLLSLYNPSECLASRAADNRLVQVLTPSRSGVSSYRSLTSAKIDSSFTVCTRQIDVGCFRLNTFDIVRSRETGAIVC